MIHIATKQFTLLLLILFAASTCLIMIPTASAAVTFTFHGPYEEGTTSLLGVNATVIFHATTGANITYTVNNSLAVSPGVNPLYFEYIYNYSSTEYHRYYWCDDTEVANGGDFYIYFSEPLTPIAFSIFGYTTLDENFDGGAYLIAKSGGGIPNYAIEKVPLDSLGDAVFTLKANTPYDLTVKADGDSTTYTFGNIATISSAITLRIPPSTFPQESLLQYPYVTFYGYRDFTSNCIVLLYNDTKSSTESFSLELTDSEGTLVYNYSVADTDNLAVNWTSAVDTTTYTANVEVEHTLYGSLSWTQTFYGEGGADRALFDLGFLGDWSFNTAYLLPAFIVLFVAACFSVLNAEAGAILATLTAIVLTLLGWLPIPVGSLVAALSFSILMALVYNKRRSGMY